MSKRDDFINVALSHKGEAAAARNWVKNVTGYPATTSAWCAAFVYACAKTVGGLYGKVMGAYSWGGAGSWFRYGTDKKIGTWTKAGYWGNSVVPKPGDLISFRWSGSSKYAGKDQYFSDHIGIVASVSGSSITTIEGNKSNACGSRTYSSNYKCVNGYFHPNWSLIGISDDGSSASNNGAFTPLYDLSNYSTDEDANIREVGYMTPDGKPSTSYTKIGLSVMNYTTGLATLVNYFGMQGLTTEYKIDISDIKDKNARAICQYFLDKKMTISNIIGILACIQDRSKFQTNFVANKGQEIGLFGWSGSRKTSLMNEFKDWNENLTHQCDFIWKEFSGQYNEVLKKLGEITEVSAQAAVWAMEIVTKQYEGWSVDEQMIKRRSDIVYDLYKQVTIIPIATSGSTTMNNGVIRTQSGKTLTSVKKKIVIPTSVKQKGGGINEIYESYGWVYNAQKNANNKGTKVGKEWIKQGQPKNRGVATVSGYYLIAMTTKFAQMGDIVTIVLADGTSFNAVLGDSKGSGNAKVGTNEWGHVYSDGVGIVEWSKWAPASESQITNNRKLDLTGWKGKRIDYVLNWGTYLQ